MNFCFLNIIDYLFASLTSLSGIFIEMALLMVASIAICGECFATKDTCVRPFLRMHSYMVDKTCLVKEKFLAVLIWTLMYLVLTL